MPPREEQKERRAPQEDSNDFGRASFSRKEAPAKRDDKPRGGGPKKDESGGGAGFGGFRSNAGASRGTGERGGRGGSRGGGGGGLFRNSAKK